MSGSRLIKISADGREELLDRVPLSGADSRIQYNESFIEELIYRYPQTLPVGEIDSAYQKPIPLCTQLNTSAGILDILLITPQGRIVVVEAKLWRNPEAKRKVVAQILDYAAELSQWSYEDLQREVVKRRRDPSTLYDIVSRHDSSVYEADFVDEVTRSLRMGRFLLLICGDGIREGLGSISEFLEQHTTLDFTFGLVELAIYVDSDGNRFVDPRIVARSVTLKRSVLQIEGGSVRAEAEPVDSDNEDREWSDRERALFDFWTNLAEELTFDDPRQTGIKPSRLGNVFLRLPSSQSWITLYFHKQADEQGIFLTFYRGEMGNYFYERLQDEKEAIESELGCAVGWRSDGAKHSIILKRMHPDIETQEGIRASKRWFMEWANAFVNVFRPRIAKYQAEI